MSLVNAWVDTNPVLLAIALFIVITLFVCGLIGVMMIRAGQSLRPIAFFFVFLGIVGVPQVVYHISHLRVPTLPNTSALDTSSAHIDAQTFAVENGTFTDLESVFGPDVDPALVRDAKPVFPDFLSKATVAQLAFKPSGETVLAAVFPDEPTASEAAHSYLRFFQIANPSGSENAGWSAERPSAGDHVRLICAGRMLMAWTGTDADSLAAQQARTLNMAAIPPVEREHPKQLAIGDSLDRLFAPWWMKAAGLIANLALAIAWFFWGSTWASSATPVPGVSPASLDELRARLLAVNEIDAPVTVNSSEDGKSIEVTWRYADARWADLARARGMRRTHRLVLRLCEERRCVRVREFWSEFDWSAGRGGADIRWKAAMGIMFFQYERERVFGLQFGPDWKPTANLSYGYTFNLQDLKQPIIEAVVKSGWTWNPVMLPFSLKF
ncbi:MAG: hypothetical protein WC655_25500 [Candidatus Hydrogenedentales bacterium]|jgi:hypothetical protein